MSDRHRSYDVVVLGGGPAGVAAATVAAESGCRVGLLESTPWLGGPIWRPGPDTHPPRAARYWLDRLGRSGADVCDQTTAVAMADCRALQVESPRGGGTVGWKRLVLAVGSQELMLPFPGWTLPHVFGAGGLQLLAKTHWPVKGKRIVVAGTGPLPWAVASYLAGKGARVTDLLEQAPISRLARFALTLPVLAPGKACTAVAMRGQLWRTRVWSGCWPVAAEGDQRVEQVTFTDGVRTWTRACDYLACAFGLVPNLHWAGLLGCRVEEDVVEVDRWQQTSAADIYCAGEMTGVAGVDAALVEGQIAGYAAAGRPDRARRWFAARRRAARFAEALRWAFAPRNELNNLAAEDTIVCRCEDVTWGRVADQPDLRSAKLQLRCGMGPCQGRVCHSALRLLKGWSYDTVRPPVVATRVDSLLTPTGSEYEQ